MQSGANEAFSRILIDKALEFSGWDLLDPHQVRFELNTATGRADYLLGGKRGSLCVLEAKREDVDPYDAKEQGRGYAENVKAPFIILSNGREHWFWNYTRKDQDAYRIERLPSQRDLERLRLKNLQPPRPLGSEIIKPDYLKKFRPDLTVRRYQIEAMDTIARQFDEKAIRKFLLEMATGTGKTILCAALIRRFLATRNAERVLFIVDRIELAKQTLEDFNVILAEYKPVLYKTARRRPGELLGSSVVVATLQSLMVETIVNERFYHRPEMFYSPDKLIISYGVPASTPAFVYNAVGRKPLPTRDTIVSDTVDSIAARFNLRYNEQKWLDATAQLVADDSISLKKFIDGDITIFNANQFRTLGGLDALSHFDARENVFEALRQSSLVRQSLLASSLAA